MAAVADGGRVVTLVRGVARAQVEAVVALVLGELAQVLVQEEHRHGEDLVAAGVVLLNSRTDGTFKNMVLFTTRLIYRSCNICTILIIHKIRATGELGRHYL